MTNPKSIVQFQACASSVSEQHLTLKLSVEDSIAFVDALFNPPKPNHALKMAALRYKQVVSVESTICYFQSIK